MIPRMKPVSAGPFRAAKPFVFHLTLLCLGGLAAFAASGGLRYRGQVFYRANKAPVAGVLVELVEAEDDGKPTDEVLGSTRADAEGHFTVTPTETTNKPVALVVSAVRLSADSSGDRTSEGYDIKSHQTKLGFLPFPSTTKANAIYIERRRPGRSDHSDD